MTLSTTLSPRDIINGTPPRRAHALVVEWSIVRLKILPNYKIEVLFADGTTGVADLVHAVFPASTVITVPVMWRPPSPSRNSALRATMLICTDRVALCHQRLRSGIASGSVIML